MDVKKKTSLSEKRQNEKQKNVKDVKKKASMWHGCAAFFHDEYIG